MKDLTLKTADEISQEAFAAMVNSYMRNGTPFLGMTSPADYEAFLRMCRAHESGKRLPRGSVPYTRYFLCDTDGTIYAQGDVRHYPSESLTRFEGYLGYGTVPDYRGMGFGTQICRLLLEKAKQWGYNEVIITCNIENQASARIIEKNGGKLIEICYWEQQRSFMKRYCCQLV